MRHLKKQPVAIFIALVLMTLSLVYGVNRSVGERATAVKEQFYHGVFDGQAGFYRPGIQGQLTQRTTAALRMLSIGEYNHREDEALVTAGLDLHEARLHLIDLLAEGATPHVLFQADQDLALAALRYYALLHPLVVSAEGEDLAALESAEHTMLGAARVIAESGYNEAVGLFNRNVMGRFPMNVLRSIVFVQMPELFA